MGCFASKQTQEPNKRPMERLVVESSYPKSEPLILTVSQSLTGMVSEYKPGYKDEDGDIADEFLIESKTGLVKDTRVTPISFK